MPNFGSMLQCLFRSLLIAVLTCNLSAQAPDAAEDIRGPKALVEIPVPEKPPVVLYSSIAAGVLLLALAVYFWKKRARTQQLKSPPEVALAILAELEATRETIAAEAFANRAAQTVRQYIADRFLIVAPRLTTEEFLHALAKDDASPLAAESDHLRSFMNSCDLAKFAGSNLDSTQRVELLNAARSFVRSTSTAVTP
jgi:Domain of unknown function (DUF4381)